MGILEQALAAAEAERAADEANRRAEEARGRALGLADLQSQAHDWGVDFDPATIKRRYNGWQVEIDVGRGCVLVLSAGGTRRAEARNWASGSGGPPAHHHQTEVHTLADLGRFIEENGRDE